MLVFLNFGRGVVHDAAEMFTSVMIYILGFMKIG
jgi:hypothetical protein